MAYYIRTARRLDDWFKHCRIKQIHITILERMFSFAWRERTSASIASMIRQDRDQAWWAGIYDLPLQIRQDSGLVHARQGQQEHYDAVFVAVWGMHWRSRLTSLTDKQQWLAMRYDFVKEACTTWALPMPFEEKHGPQHTEDGAKKYEGRDMAQVVLPCMLSRDSLWKEGIPQLEFVVDNQTLADLANLRVRITNEHYRPVVNRIRTNLRFAFTSGFVHKAGCLDPVDWRPREFNTAADLVADHIIGNRCDVDTLSLDELREHIRLQLPLQFFTDGGFTGSCGASAVVVVGMFWVAGHMQRRILGCRGTFLETASSSFEAEALALELATSITSECAREILLRK
jgi:hypothetical protein